MNPERCVVWYENNDLDTRDLEETHTSLCGYVNSLSSNLYSPNGTVSRTRPSSQMRDDFVFDMDSELDIIQFIESSTVDDFGNHAGLNPISLHQESFDDDLPFESSSLSDMESEFYSIVSPNLVLPPSFHDRLEMDGVESVWPDFGVNTRIRYDVNDDEMNSLDDVNSLDDSVPQHYRHPRFTHLDFDHCYSIRQYVEEESRQYVEEESRQYVEEESRQYVEDESSYSSDCSDSLDAGRGRNRSRSRINERCKRIKQEVISSEDEDEGITKKRKVDVQTVENGWVSPIVVPKSEPVPKITISLAQRHTPAKRGRKPKNKTTGQTNKSCPVPPKVLQAAIKQQKKRSYVTKSGRVTKISNSVETSPSTSSQSSVSNSDNEDNVDKRASHNMAERNRRQELTNLFQQLRQKVPEIKKNPKASKVSILNSSTTHVSDLEEIERQKKALKEQIKREMEHKLALVQSLENSLLACYS